ncbi:MAG: helix-turn-helix transcriptional regulator [Rhodobacterales bacterium]|nr:helix-turn-helix transcriptional regulator [Rhodobacterales bacterium]
MKLKSDSQGSEPVWAWTTDSFRPADRFDAWHATVSAFNDVAVSTDKRPDFNASSECFRLGQFLLCRNESTPLRLIRSDAQAARDQLDQDVILVMQEGESRTQSRGGIYAMAAGDVAFGSFRQGYDFTVTSSGPTRWLELICPLDLDDRLLELGSGASGPEADQTPQSRLLGQFMSGVAQGLTQLTAADAALVEHALLCLLAAARRGPSAEFPRLGDRARQTVDRARAIATIERELFSARLSADRVCDITGITRSSLYRLFEIDGGVASYIRSRRLDALRDDLVDRRHRGRTVAELAERRGFYSLSTLNRAFRSRFGCTPGDVRVAATAPVAASSAAGMAGMLRYLQSHRPA